MLIDLIARVLQRSFLAHRTNSQSLTGRTQTGREVWIGRLQEETTRTGESLADDVYSSRYLSRYCKRGRPSSAFPPEPDSRRTRMSRLSKEESRRRWHCGTENDAADSLLSARMDRAEHCFDGEDWCGMRSPAETRIPGRPCCQSK